MEKYKLENKLKVLPNIVNPIFHNNRSKIKTKLLSYYSLSSRTKNHIILFEAIKLLKQRFLLNLKLVMAQMKISLRILKKNSLENKQKAPSFKI